MYIQQGYLSSRSIEKLRVFIGVNRENYLEFIL